MDASADVDCAVIGAGISGLVCARRLRDAGRSVIVLEADDAPGGRTVHAEVAGVHVELGGQWIAAEHSRLRALCAELGLLIADHPVTGRAVTIGGPGRLRERWASHRTRRALARLAAMARGPARPTWDDETLAAWIDRQRPGRAARAQLTLLTRLSLACEPAEISLGCVVDAFARAGGFTGVIGDGRIVGGTARLIAALAGPLGTSLRCGTPCIRIERDDRGALVTTSSAGGLRARHVVLAVPPSAARAIERIPPPPLPRQRIEHAVRLAPVVTVALVYPRAFWRDRGYSGLCLGLDGPIHATAASDRVLICYTAGTRAGSLTRMDARERRALVLAQLQVIFGAPAAEPLGHAERCWVPDASSVRYRGCETVAGAGAGWETDRAALSASDGIIHHAGTEAADRWPRYMEGAVRAGERTAADVLAALNRGAGVGTPAPL